MNIGDRKALLVANKINRIAAKARAKQAVDETANIAKKSIENAIAPLKEKTAPKDEFVSNQISQLQLELKEKEAQNQSLKKENNFLQQTKSELQSKINKYKNIVKEAYKQGITSEIREQKTGIANILTTLLQHKTSVKPKIADQSTEQIKSGVKTQDVIKSKMAKPAQESTPVNSKSKVVKPIQEPNLSEIISKINNERKNQVLDKERISTASALIKGLYENTNIKDFNELALQSQKIKNNSNIKDTIIPGDELNIIVFKDKMDKTLLNTTFYSNGNYDYVIFDKNDYPIVQSQIRDGVIKRLSVEFPNVNSIPEIARDNSLKNYAQNLIANAKSNTVPKSIIDIEDEANMKRIAYYNSNGLEQVLENIEHFKKHSFATTFLSNPITGHREKEIAMRMPGNRIKYINKINKNYKTSFSVVVDNSNPLDSCRYKYLYNTSNNNITEFSDTPMLTKRDYGTISHPLTQSFTFFDISKRNIKPWDFSILNPYIK